MMNGGDVSPVMTESERRAYRYGQAKSRLQGMRKSWSNDSLASIYASRGPAMCVCAPTTHPGSFRCRHHRHHAPNLGTAGDADAAGRKRHENHAPAADQDDKSP